MPNTLRTTKEWGTTEYLQEVLEELVDDYTLGDLLSELATVCHKKAYHLAVEWQDYPAQVTWDHYGDRLEGLHYDLFQKRGA